jgi:succinate dehydrogenase/fumarate reductase flavoprotein subunit
MAVYPTVTLCSPAELEADVVVLGGGPAGAWAALSAAEAGAQVILIEKGYVGTSGATAPSNTTIIYTLPDGSDRAAALDRRVRRGHGLVDRSFADRVLQETYLQLERMAEWGYPFPRLEDGSTYYGMMRGPDYLYFLRKRLLKARVRLLEHSPALELLIDQGAVAGVSGHNRMSGEPWRVRAGAVVVATGGCAFRSGALGTQNLTGDGYLMAAETGAILSGMEFTGQYGISAVHSSVTKGIVYFWASFFDADGRPIEEAGDRQEIVARHLANGPVYAVLDKAPARLREGFRAGQPNILLPFERLGIDPFTRRFPVTLRYEGTVRGVGGLVIDDHGATCVSGLYAAGDAATRESITGAASGGGGPNASWALATGVWSGRAAATFARKLGKKPHTRALRSAGALGSRKSGRTSAPADHREVIAGVQAEMLPIDRSFHRNGPTLRASQQALDLLWSQTRDTLAAEPADPARAREALAMLATARWIVASAQVRTESRGIHRRLDHPTSDPIQSRRIFTGGVDNIWAAPERALSRVVGQ